MAKYSIGIDYGTLSGRAVLVDISNGAIVASQVLEYKHGVMDDMLCDGITKLGPNYALQHPRDYIDVLEYCVPRIIEKSGVHNSDIIGIGVDFTSCTMLPVYADGTPLCYDSNYQSCPEAYVKLWKDHSSLPYAKRLTEEAKSQGLDFIDRYGGSISSEWMIPKIMLTADRSPEIYDRCDYFIEAADWIVWQLCGIHTRSACTAGYKALWHAKYKYPPDEFFASLDPRLCNLVSEKLNAPVMTIGAKAGGLTHEMADRLCLQPGIAVAVGNIDGHATVPAARVLNEGEMLMILGTSACFMTLDREEKEVREIAGYVKDGMMPDYYGYEAGQACMGDHFAWYISNLMTVEYKEKARARGMSDIEYMFDSIKGLAPGECGLIALDWWNGNRALPDGTALTGCIIGADLSTRPTDIFRALTEATAFGARMIIDNFRKYNIRIEHIHAAGGIADKNPFLLQLYADVLGCDIRVCSSPQAAALGAAIYGAVAGGGYDDVASAARNMAHLKDVVYTPDADNHRVYNRLYDEFCRLYDYFGRGENNVMRTLASIRSDIKTNNI